MFPPQESETKFDKILDLIKTLSCGTLVGTVGQVLTTTIKTCGVVAAEKQRVEAVRYVKDAYEVKCKAETEMKRLNVESEKNRVLTLYIEKSFQKEIDEIQKKHIYDMQRLKDSKDEALYEIDQYKVFEEWLNNNANDLSDDERQNIANQIKMATSELDKLNSQEGYRGTSFESVFLTETSRVALENINETMVPEYLKKGFQGLIDEYVHFNESARDSIMERMTPDYMVIDIEKDNETYKYKEEILSGERKFYVQEKAEVMDKFAQFTSGKLSKEDFFEDLRKYVGLYYESQYSTTGNIATINNNTNFLLNAVKQIIY